MTTNQNSDARNTPQSWSSLRDARRSPGAGTYPNYQSMRTRSGHTLVFDDSKGAEHITLQHRSGSMVQFTPEGAVQFTSHNGKYEVVFGENRMKITGAYDITVDGAASLKVDGDYNMTVKNLNMTATGDLNLKGKNLNQNFTGNIDIQAKNRTEKIEGNATTQAQGALSMQSGSGSASLTSKSDSVFIGAGKSIAIRAAGGNFLVGASGNIGIQGQGTATLVGGSSAGIKGQSVAVQATGGNATLKASGEVAFEGSTVKSNPDINVGAGSAVAVTDPDAPTSVTATTPPTPSAG